MFDRYIMNSVNNNYDGDNRYVVPGGCDNYEAFDNNNNYGGYSNYGGYNNYSSGFNILGWLLFLIAIVFVVILFCSMCSGNKEIINLDVTPENLTQTANPST